MLKLDILALSIRVRNGLKNGIRMRTSCIDSINFVITTVRHDWMVESLRRWDGAFCETPLAQHSLFIVTRVNHVNCRVPYGELGVLAYVGIQAHYIAIMYRLSLTCRIVKNNSLSSTTLQKIANIKRNVLQYRMFLFGMAR